MIRIYFFSRLYFALQNMFSNTLAVSVYLFPTFPFIHPANYSMSPAPYQATASLTGNKMVINKMRAACVPRSLWSSRENDIKK